MGYYVNMTVVHGFRHKKRLVPLAIHAVFVAAACVMDRPSVFWTMLLFNSA